MIFIIKDFLQTKYLINICHFYIIFVVLRVTNALEKYKVTTNWSKFNILEIVKDQASNWHILKAVIISIFNLRDGNHSPCLKVITQVLFVITVYILGQ